MSEQPLLLRDVMSGPEVLMGVKAVWGVIEEPLMCFGSRSKRPELKDAAHYRLAKQTATKALDRPYFFSIGGGAQVPSALEGKVLELVKGTGVYGDTAAFAQGDALKARLEQWPVAIMLSEVYEIVGQPHLERDLGFPNRQILRNSYDTVIRYDDLVERLYDQLRDWPVRSRTEVQWPPGFYDPGKLTHRNTIYPKLEYSSAEGQRRWKLARRVETGRDFKLAKTAKEINRERNNGVYRCEACSFADEQPGLFDAHHLFPIAAGERQSRLSDIAVLCPTCHRIAHRKADDPLTPLPISDVRRFVQAAASNVRSTD